MDESTLLSKPIYESYSERLAAEIEKTESASEAKKLFESYLPQEFIAAIGNGLFAGCLEAAEIGRKEILSRRKKLHAASAVTEAIREYGGRNRAYDYFKLRAFTIAHVENQKILNALKDELARVLSGGGTYSDFKSKVREILGDYLSDAHLTTVYVNNLHGAYNAEKYYEQQKAKDVLPYLEYVTMEDDRVRPEHELRDGVILPKDHEWWQSNYPQVDHGCRCSTQEHDEFSLQAEGKKVTTVLPDVEPAGKGFGKPPDIENDELVPRLVEESKLKNKVAEDYGIGPLELEEVKTKLLEFSGGKAEVRDFEKRLRVIPQSISKPELTAEVLKNPQEIWTNPSQSQTLYYIQQFKTSEGIETVVAEVLGDVITSHIIFGEPTEYRKGLLLYRK